MDGQKNSADQSDKRVYTTGEAAAICRVSQQTIIRCFDAGRLTGFRVPGSKFRRIPRDELLRFMKASGIPTDALENPSHRDTRLLMVDDDPSFVRLVQHGFMHVPGFEFRSATNGYDAGLLTESFRPDVILLDFFLPDVNGSVVCERLRARPEFRECCVIGVTASSAPEDLAAMRRAGVDAVIHKPVAPAQIVEQVRNILSNRSISGARAA
ncbi:MAG: response regulator [Phycisphaerales bacterium]|nr:response regulator [Planctomycetota bacterium]